LTTSFLTSQQTASLHPPLPENEYFDVIAFDLLPQV